MAETLGAWLRARRLDRNWPVAEMGRQLHNAAKAAGDSAVPCVPTIASYVRRWERDKIVPIERYRMHYCTVLAIPPSQFGPVGRLPGGEDDAPESVHAGVSAYRLPIERIGGAACVVVMIPPTCRQVVIDMPDVQAAGTPLPGQGELWPTTTPEEQAP